MDPLYDSKGKLYAPQRFEQIVKEEYLISKTIHTSINEIDNLTPREKDLLLQFVREEQEAISRKIEENKQRSRNR